MTSPLTKLMFVHQNKPLAFTQVRLSAQSWQTDGEGKLEIPLANGHHLFEILYEDQWSPQEVITGDHRDSLLIVQVEDHRDTLPSPPHTTPLNGVKKATIPFASHLRALESRYQIDSILGRGGMGVVLKAYDNALDRIVAMKMLSESLQDNQEAQDIFMVEARQIAKLRHPNLVTVHDVTSVDGVTVLIFEFVDGQEVEQILTEAGPLPEVLVRSIASQLGSALNYVHGQSMIHRDIKPSNMILKGNGILKLIDFGLARSLEQLNLRGTQVRGTPAYMAPEQIQGEDLGPATDMYQVGVSLFEIVTGQLPFDEKKITFAHLFEDAPPVKSFVPELGDELATLIDRCLLKEPSLRPSSAEFVALAPSAMELDATRDDLALFAQFMGDESSVVSVTGQFAAPTREMSSPAIVLPKISQGTTTADDEDDFAAASSSKMPLLVGVLAFLFIGGALAFAASQMTSTPKDSTPTPDALAQTTKTTKTTTKDAKPPVKGNEPEAPASQPSPLNALEKSNQVIDLAQDEAKNQAKKDAKTSNDGPPKDTPAPKKTTRPPVTAQTKSPKKPTVNKTPKQKVVQVKQKLKTLDTPSSKSPKKIETVGAALKTPEKSTKPSETKPLPPEVTPPKVTPKTVKPEPRPQPVLKAASTSEEKKQETKTKPVVKPKPKKKPIKKKPVIPRAF